jgi:hypothetical protein
MGVVMEVVLPATVAQASGRVSSGRNIRRTSVSKEGGTLRHHLLGRDMNRPVSATDFQA